MSHEDRTPDALYLPHVAGPDPYTRAEKMTATARRLLDMPTGPPPYIEFGQQPQDASGKIMHFVRKRLDDSKRYPGNHPRAGEERHDWVDGPDGARLGYSRGD